jgi:hypothetical protein
MPFDTKDRRSTAVALELGFPKLENFSNSSHSFYEDHQYSVQTQSDIHTFCTVIVIKRLYWLQKSDFCQQPTGFEAAAKGRQCVSSK